jgi:hypothetical protein
MSTITPDDPNTGDVLAEVTEIRSMAREEITEQLLSSSVTSPAVRVRMRGPVHQMFTPGDNPAQIMARTDVCTRTSPRRDLHDGRQR